jgi:hypothetical protein
MNIAFTIDVDRDAAWFRKGQSHAITKGEEKALFESTGKGLNALLQLLEEMNWPCTFFFEAATAKAIQASASQFKEHEIACHGLNHEDFTGEATGVRMAREEKKEILTKARSLLQNSFKSHAVNGFRAPYLHYDKELLNLVAEVGFEYDSTVTRSIGAVTVESGLQEVPLLELEVEGGKKSSYLWRLMEGAYSIEDYSGFVEKALGLNDLLVLATHSWHSHRSVNKGVLSSNEAAANIEKVRGVLEKAESLGAKPTTIQNYLGKNA